MANVEARAHRNRFHAVRDRRACNPDTSRNTARVQ
jgi:hypothetical protein